MVPKNRDANEFPQHDLEEKYIDMLRDFADFEPMSKTQITHLMLSPFSPHRFSKQAVYKWVDELRASYLIEPVIGVSTSRGAERFDLTIRGLATLICSASEQEPVFFSQVSRKYRRFLPTIFDLWQPLVEARIDDIARRQLRMLWGGLHPAKREDLLKAGREVRLKQRWRRQMARPDRQAEDIESESAWKKVLGESASFFVDYFWLHVDESDYKRWIDGIRSNPALSRCVARAKLRSLLKSVDGLQFMFGKLGEFTELLVAENFEQEDAARIQELARQIASLNEAAKRIMPGRNWNRIRHVLSSLRKQLS